MSHNVPEKFTGWAAHGRPSDVVLAACLTLCLFVLAFVVITGKDCLEGKFAPWEFTPKVSSCITAHLSTALARAGLCGLRDRR